MTTIDVGANPQTTRVTNRNLPAKADPARAAWRKEMLGELLGRMREHKKPLENEAEAVQTPRPLNPQKGFYIDLYV
jgi:hypothetical protein